MISLKSNTVLKQSPGSKVIILFSPFFFIQELCVWWSIELYGNREQLQNTPQLIYMSLNKNSVYCVMPRSSKPPDTCKWGGPKLRGILKFSPTKNSLKRMKIIFFEINHQTVKAYKSADRSLRIFIPVVPFDYRFTIKFPHSPILYCAFSSWIEKTVTKTIHCHWENRFVLQKYGAVWKFLPKRFSKINPRQTSSLSLFPKRSTCISIDN